MYEQIASLFKRRVLGQIVDVVSTVFKDTFFAIYEGCGAAVKVNAGKPAMDRDVVSGHVGLSFRMPDVARLESRPICVSYCSKQPVEVTVFSMSFLPSSKPKLGGSRLHRAQ